LSFISKNKDLLLVHSSMGRVDLTGSVNIMLTPEFYTLKREELPVKYAYQAKKIAPSLFDGLLEDGGEYEYAVFKEDDHWSFIAYDIQKIVDFLESKGVSADKIGKIYFAQQAVEKFDKPLLLGEKKILNVLNNTVVVVPRMSVETEDENLETLKFDNTFTPINGGVSIKGSSSDLLSQKQAFTLASIFMLFAGIFIVEGMRYSGSDGGNNELTSLYEEYPSLKSTYTRQGIIDKYRMINQIERKKRDTIKSLSGMIFKGVTLSKVDINDQNFKAEYSCKTADAVKHVKNLAKKAHFHISNSKEKNKLIIEGTL